MQQLVGVLVAGAVHPCTILALNGYIALEQASNLDAGQLVNGHDVCAVLGIALRQLLGKRRDVHTWAREIEAGLRLAYDWNSFILSNLYGKLRDWEAKSAPYRLFAKSV